MADWTQIIDDEIDDEDIGQYVNETPLPEVSHELRNLSTSAKKTLYSSIVFSNINSTNEQSQDNTLADKYLKSVQELYQYILVIMKHADNTTSIDYTVFPENARASIKQLLEWLENYIETTPMNVDRIIYDDYLHSYFHVFPYVQTEEFI